MEVTRRQSLRQQIDTAITLFLLERESIAANTLAWAALDVLRSLLKREGKETTYARIDASLTDEERSEWRSSRRLAYTWAKHADRDPDAVVTFHLGMLAIPLVAAVNDYAEAFGQRTRPMLAYVGWFGWWYNDLVEPEPSVKRTAEAAVKIFGDPAKYDFRQSLEMPRLILSKMGELGELLVPLGNRIEF